MGALVPYIIAGTATGAGISMAQKKDPLKGALYGAGTGGIGSSLIGSTPSGAKFLGAEKATIPPTPSPMPSPVAVDVETLQKERAKRRERLRKLGLQGTILTEGGLGEPMIKKATLLGERAA